jgi:hypothetical protein
MHANPCTSRLDPLQNTCRGASIELEGALVTGGGELAKSSVKLEATDTGESSKLIAWPLLGAAVAEMGIVASSPKASCNIFKALEASPPLLGGVLGAGLATGEGVGDSSISPLPVLIAAITCITAAGVLLPEDILPGLVLDLQ